MWVIGDVAGEYEALKELLAKIKDTNDDTEIVFCGDLVDRGPKSAQVIDLIKTNGYIALYGNHEDMMVDYVERSLGISYNDSYTSDDWLMNGGSSTLRSYGNLNRKIKLDDTIVTDVAWLKKLPRYYISKDNQAIVTHAPIDHNFKDLALDKIDTTGFNFMWNRSKPIRREHFQFYGHNGHIITHADVHGHYAMCVDSSRDRPSAISAVHFPTFELIQVEF
jgi:hypothetical protein